ncbi:MAG: CPBP family intramembrane metalloprotease [Firmicutes bacterium]|nr:CPBP family intramembrane metalloprotease [Bacillota bacterium]
MQKKSSQQQVNYVKPEWKIWHSLCILILVIFLGVILAPFEKSAVRPGGFILFANVVQFACFFLIPLYISGVICKQPLQSLGIQVRIPKGNIIKGLSWGALLYVLNVLASAVIEIVFPGHPEEPQMIMQIMMEESSAFELACLVFCVTVLAPLGEEIFFRSFMMGALQNRFGRLAAVLLSAVVFAAVHGSLWFFFPLFVGGCGFALLFAKYRDISINIIAHATWNSIAVLLMFALR